MFQYVLVCLMVFLGGSSMLQFVSVCFGMFLCVSVSFGIFDGVQPTVRPLYRQSVRLSRLTSVDLRSNRLSNRKKILKIKILQMNILKMRIQEMIRPMLKWNAGKENTTIENSEIENTENENGENENWKYRPSDRPFVWHSRVRRSILPEVHLSVHPIARLWRLG